MKILYLLLCCMPSFVCKSAKVEEFHKSLADNKSTESKEFGANKRQYNTMDHFQPEDRTANNQESQKVQKEPLIIETLAENLYKGLSEERKQKFIKKFDNLKQIDIRIQDLILNKLTNIDDDLIEKIKSEIKKEDSYSRFIGKDRSQHFIDALKKALDKATSLKSNSTSKESALPKVKIKDQTTVEKNRQEMLDNKQKEEREKANKINGTSTSIYFDRPTQPTKPTDSAQDEKATKELLKNLIFNTEPQYKIKSSEGQVFDIVTKEEYDQSSAFPINKRTYQDKYNYSSVKIKEYTNPLQDNPDIKKLEKTLQNNNPAEQKKAFKSFIDTLTTLREANLEDTKNINRQITLLKYGADGKSPKQNLTDEENQKLKILNEQENKTKALTEFIDSKITEINKNYPKFKKAYDESTKPVSQKVPTTQPTPKVDKTPAKPEEKTAQEKLQDLEKERDDLAKEKETLKDSRKTLSEALQKEQRKLKNVGSASTDQNNKEIDTINAKIKKLQKDISSIDQKINENATKTTSLSQKIEDSTDNKNKPEINDEPVDYTGSAW